MKILRSPKAWFGLVVVIIIGITAWKFPVAESLMSLIGWIQEQGVVGYGVYIVVYTLGAVLFLPGSILTLGAGFAWGVILGSALVSISSTLGATLAFLVGRYLARDWVRKKIEKNEGFKSIDKAVARQGFKIVFLTRLSPVFPFSFQNYAYGLTGVSLWNYVAASWSGMIPGTIMYVYLGSLITEITQLSSGQTQEEPVQKILYGVGLLVTVFVTVIITRIAKKALSSEENSDA